MRLTNKATSVHARLAQAGNLEGSRHLRHLWADDWQAIRTRRVLDYRGKSDA
jgi:hypothetical protein